MYEAARRPGFGHLPPLTPAHLDDVAKPDTGRARARRASRCYNFSGSRPKYYNLFHIFMRFCSAWDSRVAPGWHPRTSSRCDRSLYHPHEIESSASVRVVGVRLDVLAPRGPPTRRPPSEAAAPARTPYSGERTNATLTSMRVSRGGSGRFRVNRTLCRIAIIIPRRSVPPSSR